MAKIIATLKISDMFTPFTTAAVANTLNPTGGDRHPNVHNKLKNTPNQIASKPAACTIGSNKGIVSTYVEFPSKNMNIMK